MCTFAFRVVESIGRVGPLAICTAKTTRKVRCMMLTRIKLELSAFVSRT